MTTIDNLVEKYEKQTDRIKYKPLRNIVRGFILGVDLPGFVTETFKRLEKARNADKESQEEFYTLGCKSMTYFMKDYMNRPSKYIVFGTDLAAFFPAAIGGILGVKYSCLAWWVPWIVTSVLDLTNYYTRKKQSRLK